MNFLPLFRPRKLTLFLLVMSSLVFTKASAQSFPKPRFLTHPSDANDYWPGFTADGQRVFFSRQAHGKSWELFEVPTDGGEARILWKGVVGATRASAGPDRLIAFTGVRSGQVASLWLTNDNAENVREIRLHQVTGAPFYPTWYPDGSHVAMVAYQGNSGGNLIKVNLATGSVENLTDPALIRCGMPFVSPDGNSIVFAGQRPPADNVYDQTRNSVWIRSNDGVLKQVSPGQGRAPVWSPDGKWIAYESTEGSLTGKYAIYLASADGKINRQISDFEWNANHPVFSPDGKWLVVSAHHPEHPSRTGIAIIPSGLNSVER